MLLCGIGKWVYSYVPVAATMVSSRVTVFCSLSHTWLPHPVGKPLHWDAWLHGSMCSMPDMWWSRLQADPAPYKNIVAFLDR